MFQANLESNDQPLVTWQTYQLKKNEKLEHVAAKFGIGMQRLKEVNGITGRKRVRPGQMVLVPLEAVDEQSNLDETYKSPDFQAPAEEQRVVAPREVRRHAVQHRQAVRHHGSRSSRSGTAFAATRCASASA